MQRKQSRSQLYAYITIRIDFLSLFDGLAVLLDKTKKDDARPCAKASLKVVSFVHGTRDGSLEEDKVLMHPSARVIGCRLVASFPCPCLMPLCLMWLMAPDLLEQISLVLWLDPHSGILLNRLGEQSWSCSRLLRFMGRFHSITKLSQCSADNNLMLLRGNTKLRGTDHRDLQWKAGKVLRKKRYSRDGLASMKVERCSKQ